MIEFVAAIWAISLFLYALFAGADFGAGIIELLPIGLERTERSNLIGKAIGPVWEANHIWLILAVVIAFNGFPEIFWFLFEYLHFPLGGLVIGIIFRGVGFTFMHYDPIKDKSQNVYHWIFGLSSLWCTMWLGIIIGSLMLGDFLPREMNTYQRYFGHWLNGFSLSMGIFITMLMVFNASLFLYVESTQNRALWRRMTVRVLWLLILSGLLSHLIFYFTAPDRWKMFFYNPISLIFIVLSFALLFPQHILINLGFRNWSRIVAGAQLLMIMAAGFVPLFPNIILFKNGEALDLYSTAAEPYVIKTLGLALAFGCLFILPSYFYLMKIFKSQKPFQNE